MWAQWLPDLWSGFLFTGLPDAAEGFPDRARELGYRGVRVDSLRILVQWSDTSVSAGQCDAKLGLLAIRLLPPASELYGCGGGFFSEEGC